MVARRNRTTKPRKKPAKSRTQKKTSTEAALMAGHNLGTKRPHSSSFWERQTSVEHKCLVADAKVWCPNEAFADHQDTSSGFSTMMASATSHCKLTRNRTAGFVKQQNVKLLLCQWKAFLCSKDWVLQAARSSDAVMTACSSLLYSASSRFNRLSEAATTPDAANMQSKPSLQATSVRQQHCYFLHVPLHADELNIHTDNQHASKAPKAVFTRDTLANRQARPTMLGQESAEAAKADTTGRS